MPLNKSGRIYHFLLQVMAIVHLGVGFHMLWLMKSHGPFLWGWMYAGILVLVGCILLGGRFLTPRYLWHPQGAGQAIAAILTLAVLAGGSFYWGGGIGRWMEIRGAYPEPTGRTVGFAPGLALGVLIVTLILPILIALTARLPKNQEDSLTEGSERFLALSMHRALLALCGIATVAFGVSVYLRMSRNAEVAAFYSSHDLRTQALIAAGLSVLVGLSFMSTRTMPRFVHRPTRWFHFPLIGLYLVVLSAMAIGVLLVPALSAFFDDAIQNVGQGPGPYRYYQLSSTGPIMEIVSSLAFFGLIVTTILVIMREPSGTDGKLRPYSSHREGDMPEVKKLSKREQAARKAAATVDNGKLPTIGAAMKLYVATDWLMFRLLGVGLLGTGYLLWTFIEGERDFQAAQLSYGFAPMHALYGYVAVGALMALPFMLPRFIVRPQNVIGGLAKAFLLVVIGLILLPMLHVGIDMFFDDMYRPTLHATVPNVFKALMGVSVTAALLISFFRQLGATPKMDYQGRVVREYSAKELADLRHARMPHD